LTVITVARSEILPAGASPVASWGLLSRVARPCPDHRGECPCVGRHEDVGCLVFWCDAGEHHFTSR
jgi:hypothetical protein